MQCVLLHNVQLGLQPRPPNQCRFIGLRSACRPCDFTWIQALGLMYDNHAFTVEATRAARWDAAVDHLSFTFDGEPFKLAEGHLAVWRSPYGKVAVERTRSRNSVILSRWRWR
ncbi:hypothetical protein Cni_G04855 [Canna indica]|uniref:Uncharacterized protein n=1 Tax=Canna indica TaxID=4628 RepID=A0AAQ3JVJ2_9LILI|nr:hypothetical protein Cni_G04855 [Canna indica]